MRYKQRVNKLATAYRFFYVTSRITYRFSHSKIR